MIKLHVEGNVCKELIINGSTIDIYKELSAAVLDVLEQITPPGKQLSRTVTEFGQMLAVIGTVGKKELDEDDEKE